MHGPSPILRQAIGKGEPPSAREQTAINRAIAGVVNSGPALPLRGMLRLFRLATQFGADDSSSSAGHKQQGQPLRYAALENEWADSSAPASNTITDPLDLVWDQNYRAICFYDRQSGLRIPINPCFVRHARTVADDDGSYPQENASPNVYPIKFTKITYTKAAGRQTPTIEWLDSTEGPDDYVINSSNGVEPSYLAEGVDIWCYPVPVNAGTSWFTNICCPIDAESSDSSS